MRDIKSFEGLYAITSCGKVWSYRNNMFLKAIKQKNGYYQVNLYKDSKLHHYYVHRLVAMAYLGNPANLPEVNHKDENKANNALSNLEWASAKVNTNYGTRNKRISAKSKRKQIYCIELDKTFNSLSKCAQDLNIATSNLCSCLKGRYKTVGGYHFKYV